MKVHQIKQDCKVKVKFNKEPFSIWKVVWAPSFPLWKNPSTCTLYITCDSLRILKPEPKVNYFITLTYIYIQEWMIRILYM